MKGEIIQIFEIFGLNEPKHVVRFIVLITNICFVLAQITLSLYNTTGWLLSKLQLQIHNKRNLINQKKGWFYFLLFRKFHKKLFISGRNSLEIE